MEIIIEDDNTLSLKGLTIDEISTIQMALTAHLAKTDQLAKTEENPDDYLSFAQENETTWGLLKIIFEALSIEEDKEPE